MHHGALDLMLCGWWQESHNKFKNIFVHQALLFCVIFANLLLLLHGSMP
jgi:hypothetical protein